MSDEEGEDASMSGLSGAIPTMTAVKSGEAVDVLVMSMYDAAREVLSDRSSCVPVPDWRGDSKLGVRRQCRGAKAQQGRMRVLAWVGEIDQLQRGFVVLMMSRRPKNRWPAC